ncbi:MAG: ATP-binding cassette domain-containing protein [Bacteroidia bacterium]|nr:ATP-binding cassette domain-containing protein [Bacteroidia bacterium]
MKIILDKAGRRFNNDWIFKNICCEFVQGNIYGIIGNNGSGKSTLLQVLTSQLMVSEGACTFIQNNKPYDSDQWHNNYSFASPYLQLFEEYSLTELLTLHNAVKPFYAHLSVSIITEKLNLTKQRNKAIRYYSSGMKQRVKLALALYSNTPVLLLDEPTSNLDAQNTTWFQQQLQEYSANRLVVIASNSIDTELFLCTRIININEYKN